MEWSAIKQQHLELEIEFNETYIFTSLFAAETNLATAVDCFVVHTITGSDSDGDPTYVPHLRPTTLSRTRGAGVDAGDDDFRFLGDVRFLWTIGWADLNSCFGVWP